MVSLPIPVVHNVALTPEDGVLSLQVWDATTDNWAIWNISASCPVGTRAFEHGDHGGFAGGGGGVFTRGGGGFARSSCRWTRQPPQVQLHRRMIS